MTDKEIAKAAFDQLDKENRDNKIKEVKAIVQATLDKREKLKKQIQDLQKEKKILDSDLEDLRNGRLDLIAERQEKNPEAAKVSVVIIVKEKEIVREVPVYYWPYHITWQMPTYPSNVFLSGLSIASNSTGMNNSLTIGNSYTLTSNVVKSNYAGTYTVNNDVIDLR